MTKSVLGIIGGSGIYDLPGLESAREEAIQSPWGEPSAPVRRGTIAGLPIVFLPRHDKGHRLSPSDINYRANIDVLKRAGVTDLISLSACGSFREDLPPGTGASSRWLRYGGLLQAREQALDRHQRGPRRRFASSSRGPVSESSRPLSAPAPGGRRRAHPRACNSHARRQFPRRSPGSPRPGPKSAPAPRSPRLRPGLRPDVSAWSRRGSYI